MSVEWCNCIYPDHCAPGKGRCRAAASPGHNYRENPGVPAPPKPDDAYARGRADAVRDVGCYLRELDDNPKCVGPHSWDYVIATVEREFVSQGEEDCG